MHPGTDRRYRRSGLGSSGVAIHFFDPDHKQIAGTGIFRRESGLRLMPPPVQTAPPNTRIEATSAVCEVRGMPLG